MPIKICLIFWLKNGCNLAIIWWLVLRYFIETEQRDALNVELQLLAIAQKLGDRNAG